MPKNKLRKVSSRDRMTPAQRAIVEAINPETRKKSVQTEEASKRAGKSTEGLALQRDLATPGTEAQKEHTLELGLFAITLERLRESMQEAYSKLDKSHALTYQPIPQRSDDAWWLMQPEFLDPEKIKADSIFIDRFSATSDIQQDQKEKLAQLQAQRQKLASLRMHIVFLIKCKAVCAQTINNNPIFQRMFQIVNIQISKHTKQPLTRDAFVEYLSKLTNKEFKELYEQAKQSLSEDHRQTTTPNPRPGSKVIPLDTDVITATQVSAGSEDSLAPSSTFTRGGTAMPGVSVKSGTIGTTVLATTSTGLGRPEQPTMTGAGIVTASEIRSQQSALHDPSSLEEYSKLQSALTEEVLLNQKLEQALQEMRECCKALGESPAQHMTAKETPEERLDATTGPTHKPAGAPH